MTAESVGLDKIRRSISCPKAYFRTIGLGNFSHLEELYKSSQPHEEPRYMRRAKIRKSLE